MSQKNAKFFEYVEDGECDICDNKNYTIAVFEDLLGNCSFICKKCLQNILKLIDEAEEVE